MATGWDVLAAGVTTAADADGEILGQDCYLVRKPVDAPARRPGRGAFRRFMEWLPFGIGRGSTQPT